MTSDITVVGAFRDGLRRVRRAPALVAGVWAATILLAVPMAAVLGDMIAEHLGNSLVADAVARGVNMDWWNEFLAQAQGVGQTFLPATAGFAAVLKNLSAVADAEPLPVVLVAVVVGQLIFSTFLVGGVLDRLARDRTVGAAGFFAACGVWGIRFVRLALLAAPLYWLLFTTVHPWLFDTLYPALTRDLAVERTAFAYRVALYAVFASLLMAVNLLFDYAKIRAVVEDRRSMVGALAAAWRFIARNPGAALGLYFLDTLAFVAVAALYAVAAPGASSGLLVFAVGQAYIVLRIVVRLQFAASQVALFQGRLAHAGYVAAPVHHWPDSPAAEALRL